MSSLGSSSPKTSLDKSCINIRKAEDQSCNVTDDNLGSDCYESMHAFKKIRTSTSGLRKSPNKWTKEENQKLATLVSSYGEKKWKRISAEMGGQKTGAQCAQHWKRVLSPEIRKGHWDENEEDLLLRLVVQYGSCWKKIAKKIPQRTDIQCRYQYLKAKQSREVMWDPKEDESLMKKVMEMANCNFFQVLNDAATPVTQPSTTTPNSSSNGNDSPSSTSSMNSPSFTNSPLRGSSQYNTASPMLSPNASRSIRIPPICLNKENEDNALSSSYGSGSESREDTDEEEYARMKMSGDFTKDAWNDDKHNVNMGGGSPDGATTTSWRSGSGGMGGKELNSPFSDRLCANCRSPFTSHLNKVVWLEISEHMARLKLTSTLRTALECKTRFTELLGNKVPYVPNSFINLPESKASGLKNSGDLRRGYNHPLGGSGGFSAGAPSFTAGPSAFTGPSFSAGASSFNAAPSLNAGPSSFSAGSSSFSAGSSSFNGGASESKGSFHNGSLSDIKINAPLNKSPSSGNPNINLTNCNNNNITINITNSYTTNTNQSGSHFQQLTHNSPTAMPLKSEHNSTPLPGPSHLLSKAATASILSPAPPFPSFSHMSLPSFPHLPQPHMSKPSPRNTISGLESLAAVASILPREMLADYF